MTEEVGQKMGECAPQNRPAVTQLCSNANAQRILQTSSQQLGVPSTSRFTQDDLEDKWEGGNFRATSGQRVSAIIRLSKAVPIKRNAPPRSSCFAYSPEHVRIKNALQPHFGRIPIVMFCAKVALWRPMATHATQKHQKTRCGPEGPLKNKSVARTRHLVIERSLGRLPQTWAASFARFRRHAEQHRNCESHGLSRVVGQKVTAGPPTSPKTVTPSPAVWMASADVCSLFCLLGGGGGRKRQGRSSAHGRSPTTLPEGQGEVKGADTVALATGGIPPNPAKQPTN